MALACLGQVKSRVKGYHVYDHNYKVNEKLECFVEPENEYSKNTIIVKSKDIVVGHVPEALAEKLFPLMKQRKMKLKPSSQEKNDEHLKEHGSLGRH